MDRNNQYDVIVAGLGAWGSAAAWHLARRGHRVLGLDRFSPPHDQGSHSGVTRLARRSSHEGVEYAPLTTRSFELWSELASESGLELVTTTGALVCGPEASPLLEVSAASLERLDLPFEMLGPADIGRRFPEFRLRENELALFEPGAAVLMSADGIRAHLSGTAARGAEIRTSERVLSWAETDEGVVVETERESYAADHLILTLGAWNPDLLDLELPLVVERQILATFETGDWARELPCLFAHSVVTGGEEVGFYGGPEPNSRLKFALHHGGKPGHPDELSREAREDDIDRVRAELRERLPRAAEAAATGKVCLYTNSPDSHWVIDVHPAAASVVFATGCSGRGYRYAPAIGEALADLVEGRQRPDLAFLSSNRFLTPA